MHLASQLGGTSTPLRETAASSFSGPVTKVLFGVGIALFILFKLGVELILGEVPQKYKIGLHQLRKICLTA